MCIYVNSTQNICLVTVNTMKSETSGVVLYVFVYGMIKFLSFEVIKTMYVMSELKLAGQTNACGIYLFRYSSLSLYTSTEIRMCTE